MDFTTISKASDKILNDLLNDKKIQDEMLLEIIAEVIKYVLSGANGKIPISFFRLAEYVNNLMQSDEINHRPANVVLAYGKIWSIASTIDIFEYYEQMEKELEADAKRYEDQYDFFRTIRDYSGIAHEELAKAIGGSPSDLSGLIDRMDHGKYFMYRILGRRKYYFITDAGKSLINKIEENYKNCNLKKDFRHLRQYVIYNKFLEPIEFESDKMQFLKENSSSIKRTNLHRRVKTTLPGKAESSSKKQGLSKKMYSNVNHDIINSDLYKCVHEMK